MTVRLLVTLDTECDKGPGWRIRRPLSFRNVADGIADRLHPLLLSYGLRPTYLLSPEVLGDDESVSILRALPDAELGTHLHAEFVEPDADPGADVTAAFQSDLAPAVERAKLANLTALFTECFGTAPRSFRAGRYGLGPHTLGFLEELGYRVDSSVTPHAWWRSRAAKGVSFLGAPDQPYRPSREDFRRAGDMAILEVPITLVSPFWDRWPRAVRRSLNPLGRWQTIALNATGVRRRTSWLRPSFSDAERMLAATDYLVGRERGAAVLCMMFHSNETTPGTSPYCRDRAEVDRFFDRLQRYWDGLLARFDVVPATLREVGA